ncbi:hypothetical protein GCM10010112_91960 [Actinoplanes lobatus]|uniref:Uncharacterized protein n=1 Tax=Actinoplanes lobatus TaxID=113568 RepID=A0A7W7HKL1_9ACTN|nr:hypothetical protein [Actinoplanes lobatus]MBB4752249.1 hypothetical protein [Actinoplanes lobatus]GGN98761.1 hypothetical protein GCM10010112_91960 [Actinoplanes lobatus]GIE46181.1 hypothetical protein Alo02nite_90790 [Actinoplanes lobatus]
MTLLHAIKVQIVEDVWTVSRNADGSVRLTLRIGPPRPLVAVLTEPELASVANVMPTVAEAVRRDEFSRIKLATMFRTAIGRDPFRQAATVERRAGHTVWWADVAYIVVGLGFAASHSNLWLRLAGWAFAAIALGDLVRNVWRRFH